MDSKIRNARLRARLSQAEVGAAIGKSDMWVSLAERNRVPVTTELERRILKAISGLSDIRETQRRSVENLQADLRLPVTAGSSIR